MEDHEAHLISLESYGGEWLPHFDHYSPESYPPSRDRLAALNTQDDAANKNPSVKTKGQAEKIAKSIRIVDPT